MSRHSKEYRKARRERLAATGATDGEVAEAIRLASDGFNVPSHIVVAIAREVQRWRAEAPR